MNNKSVVILDYQLGNLFSVKQACDRVGIQCVISSDKNDLTRAAGVILPGVGAFGEAMRNLNNLDLVEPLRDYVASGRPFFGVCLGQQLLFTESEEFGTSKGLNLIPGIIRRFPPFTILNTTVKVPQIGWNHIYVRSQPWRNTPLSAIKENAFVYFVHSYYVQPEKEENVLAVTNYEGIEYCSSVIKKPNIFATQFHPEKSGELGLGIYRNWAESFNLL